MHKSNKVVTVKMLTAEGCKCCAAVEARILAASKKLKVKLNLVKIDCLSEDAVHLGITYGLSDIPAFVVAGRGFSGDRFPDNELVEAMRLAQ